MLRNGLIGIGALALLAGCGEPDVVLPGERLGLRAGMAGADPVTSNAALPLALPAAVQNPDWSHRNGGPDHAITHPALVGSLQPLFRTSIGSGDSRAARITAEPVVASGRVFTLDAGAGVTALTTGGAPIWSRDLTPATDNRGDASGGGLAVGGGTLFVSTGFGELTALDAATGAELWRQDLAAPGSSAPTVFGGLVYVVGRDGQAWALDAGTGRVAWQLRGIGSIANFDGGAGAAVTSDIAVFPFPSGEVLAAFPDGGLQRWSSVVAGGRSGQAASLAATGISGDPVIDGDRVYVGNVSGRLAALELATGETLWTARDGALSPVWPAGGSLFLINDLNQLVRLDAASGAPIWRVVLPDETRGGFLRRDSRVANYGPVLAGGRLIVASSDGAIRQFDPVSGAALAQLDLPGGAASNPVVAGGVLYVVTSDGALAAFR